MAPCALDANLGSQASGRALNWCFGIKKIRMKFLKVRQSSVTIDREQPSRDNLAQRQQRPRVPPRAPLPPTGRDSLTSPILSGDGICQRPEVEYDRRPRRMPRRSGVACRGRALEGGDNLIRESDLSGLDVNANVDPHGFPSNPQRPLLTGPLALAACTLSIAFLWILEGRLHRGRPVQPNAESDRRC